MNSKKPLAHFSDVSLRIELKARAEDALVGSIASHLAAALYNAARREMATTADVVSVVLNASHHLQWAHEDMVRLECMKANALCFAAHAACVELLEWRLEEWRRLAA